MGAKLNVANVRFGRLVAVSPERDSQCQLVWRCRCDCGGTAVQTVGRLRSGHTQSCGCLAFEDYARRAHSRAHQLAGKQFGDWAVMERAWSDKPGTKTSWWKCRCICGTVKAVSAATLVGGSSTGCGCAARAKAREQARVNFADKIARTRRPEGVSSKRRLYLAYQNGAIDRGHIFDLDFDAAIRIMESPCSYCGAEPRERVVARRSNGVFKATGIDRVDNALGYVQGNCVPCCSECNMAKGKRTAAQFEAWIRRVYAVLETKDSAIALAAG